MTGSERRRIARSRLALGTSVAALLVSGAIQANAATLPACDTQGATTTLEIARQGADGAAGHGTVSPGAGGTGAPISCRLDDDNGKTLVPTVARSNGGTGGKGDEFNAIFVIVGSPGGAGGAGGTVNLAIDGTLNSNNFGYGVLAVGGVGGDGGVSFKSKRGSGGAGGAGGNGGDVTLTHGGTLTVGGYESSALEATSTGRAGGLGGGSSKDLGDAVFLGLAGGEGGKGGDGGKASIVNTGHIVIGNGAYVGIRARSTGGDGNTGGMSDRGLLGQVKIGARGGHGGHGGVASVTNSGSIKTDEIEVTAILAQTSGGNGGTGGSGIGGVGGNGGDGGTVNVTNSGTILTTKMLSDGIFAQSVAGQGGAGGESAAGGSGGSGGDVTVNNSGTITTQGYFSTAIYGISVAGGGQDGGASEGEIAVGGDGGAGGRGGKVTVDMDGTALGAGEYSVHTQGAFSNGIHLISVGGGGGRGGNAVATGTFSAVAIGGKGGAAGDGGGVTVHLNKAASILTEGDLANAIIVQSIGGGGGSGGSAHAQAYFSSVAIGGSGGAGGDGGTLDVRLGDQASIATRGHHASAIIAQSIGGGGGSGGQAHASSSAPILATSVSMGGNGASGGDGGEITINLGAGSSISTGTENSASAHLVDGAGTHSVGVLAQSVGGGGGNGGSAGSSSVSYGGGVSFSASVAIGGKGGTGGNGGKINGTADGSVTTYDANSDAIVLQSVGGGGGNGGGAHAFSLSVGNEIDSISASVAIGGHGGHGGDGETVTLGSAGAIRTEGDNSDGIVLQSIGGGGGNGGSALAFSAGVSIGPTLNASVAIGGGGGTGGVGRAVTFNGSGSVTTQGRNALGVVAQSVGGGGGNGGSATTVSVSASTQQSITLGASVGGGGGSGGHGDAVTIKGVGNISTSGENSIGVLAQSVGGGGGNGGNASAVTLSASAEGSFSAPVAVGGNGGDGGNGGTVSLTTKGGSVTTAGANSAGMLIQSIGGGGGNAGTAMSVNASITTGPNAKSITTPVSVGGSGGPGGTAGKIDISSATVIATSGDTSSGLIAQSIAGGGGNGGAAITANVTISDEARGSLGGGAAIGGGGGTGHKGGTIDLTSSGAISTGGDISHAILVQSLGGGGGNGGSASTLTFTLSAPADLEKKNNAVNLETAIGGSAGSGNHGGTVSATNTAVIRTLGNHSAGVLVQSVGGGGGAGGNVASLSGAAGKSVTSVGVDIGGKGGAGGDGGDITAKNTGTIATLGNNSVGVLLQSIGGGGGYGGNSARLAAGAGAKVKNLNAVVGGTGGSGGDGGSSDKAKQSFTNSGVIVTQGHRSAAVVVQSLGGGGGAGGDVLTRTASLGAKNTDHGKRSVTSGTTTLTMGGAGGNGGNGLAVSIANDGTASTFGANAHGLVGQSIGGGGGMHGLVDTYDLKDGTGGGASSSTAPDVKAVITRAVERKIFGGAEEGTQGNGGTVDIRGATGSVVSTAGAASHAVLAQSIGGGGGDIGHVEALSLQAGESAPGTESAGTDSSTYDFTVQLGSGDHTLTSQSGKSSVTLAGGASVVTSGAGSRGVLSQSVSGGGGTFATVLDSTHVAGEVSTATFNVTLGGEQGHSGHPAQGGEAGATLQTTDGHAARVATGGDLSHGVVAQSVASGGGSAGVIVSDALSVDHQDITATLGGTGAAEGAGGKASVSATGTIMTDGAGSFGILAQSVGSGGGEFVADLARSDSATLHLDFGTRTAGYADAGEARADLTGTVSTSGDLSHAIVVQSVGGGGGIAGVLADGIGSVDLHSTFGKTVSAGGNGGAAKVALTGGAVSTIGDFAHGVLAQSIGGGGGLLSLDTDGGAVTLDLSLQASGSGAGGDVSVSLDSASTISTTGHHAHGIFAQSAGNGGGLVTVNGKVSGTPTSHIGASGAGGSVTVTSHGDISTFGDYSDGIFAYSASGAALVMESADGVREITGYETGTQSGQVSVTQSGTVSVSGAHASGIHALARRSDGLGIALDVSGKVIASGEGGAGIRAINGIAATSGGSRVSTKVDIRKGAFVLARDADTATSAIVIGDERSAFELKIEGTVAAVGADGSKIATYGGKQRAVSASGHGAIVVGESGGVEGTIEVARGTVAVLNRGVIDGSVINAGLYTTEKGSRHFLEIDPVAGTSAYISALAVTHNGGTLNPYLSSFGKLANSVEIVDSLGASAFEGHVSDTPVLSFQTSSDMLSVKVTGVDASFADAGLSGNAASVARAVDPLVARWMDGEAVSAGDERLYEFLLGAANTTTLSALSRTLTDHLDASQDYDLAVTQHTAAISHIDNLHSCGTQYGPWAALREDECTWGKATQSFTDNFAANTTVRLSGFSFGRQASIAENWRLGLGAGFNVSNSSGAGVSSDGYGIHAGGVLKYTQGPWLATAALSGSYSWGDSKRYVPVSGDIARARLRAAGISGRVRLAHELDFGRVFAIPTLDLDMSWIHDFGYTERDAGSLGLALDAHDMFIADLHPQLRIGTDLRFDDDLVVRPYLEAGVAFALDNEHRMTQSFASGALAGAKLSLTSEREKVRGTVAAGFSVLQGERFEAKLHYSGSFGEESRSHSASLKVGLHF
ncbi:autotransporter outer membrane beta-barrel domain-containing protein [Stappia sp.]|uniref:autotransporter outer membrane beta-barrel domain-containing protein n=1 Tax=Stappia sp. TaxID=1870903 RepID=UPI0025D09C35|nr:autotransporter outer membrane beta-barrel domain-containing protein [Stappia sp.]